MSVFIYGSVMLRIGVCLLLTGLSSAFLRLQSSCPSGVANRNCNERLHSLFMNTPELIARHGYPAETHQVVTEDGYVLSVHRIPGSPKAASGGVKTPVLLQHGILAASDFWVTTGPEHALGFLLADQGYDVWLGNARGNFYSRKHVRLSPKNTKFWNFSWHEMGVYDLPAVIDHILKVTGQEKLFYIGHSMGTTMFFVLTSTRPEYNQKVRFMVATAPVLFSKALTIRNLPAKLILPYADIIYRGIVNSGEHELLPRIKAMGQLFHELCRDGSKTQILCQLGYYFTYGNNGPLLNSTMLPEILYRVMSGVSARTVFHFVQIMKTGRFQLFDPSGRSEGIRPEYNLTQVTVPLSVHYAYNDIWAVREGVEPLAKRVQNAVKLVRLPDDRFNHNDFGVGINARELIYEEILQILASH